MTLSHRELIALTRLWTAAGQKASAVEGRLALTLGAVVDGLSGGGDGPARDYARRIARDGVNFGYLYIDAVEETDRGVEVWLGLTPVSELFRRDNP